MINSKKFKEILVAKNISQDAVAQSIGMNRSNFDRKIEKGSDVFTIGEIEKMMEVIPLTRKEAKVIFL
ncbi:helix-turn-helix domain-containing protein [Salinicoccus sesuvii]|uniref:Helix-turn-helix domain-containing protein n=1 Tax=Salinicoccus sesuvii TaxID=868281 RepID=A0ABV7N5X2_9STAP